MGTLSESLTGRTQTHGPELQRLPLSEEDKRLRASMLEVFPECAWWHRKFVCSSQRRGLSMDYGILERRVYMHALEYTPRDFYVSLIRRNLQVRGESFDHVTYDLGPPRKSLPPIKTDVQARISGPTLALFLGGCILRSETRT